MMIQLQLLEEKHNALSEKHTPEPVLIGDMEAEEEQEDKTCRTLSNALDEVHHKGTLMERLEMLEKRVLQVFQLGSIAIRSNDFRFICVQICVHDTDLLANENGKSFVFG